tara:strand:- start:4452 stop:4985 length:534 start_codon:yes stop_codon:yes gene_type:complete
MISLTNNKKGKILKFFLENPTKVTHLRELARLTKISLPWTRKTIIELTKENYLEKKRERGLVLINANRDYELFYPLKKSYNLFSLYESGLINKLVEEYTRPEAIILFGSYSKGEDTEESDIDIAIITKRKNKIDLSSFEKKFSRKIKIYELDLDKIEKEFINTLANGIILSGYLEIK